MEEKMRGETREGLMDAESDAKAETDEMMEGERKNTDLRPKVVESPV